MTKGAGVRYLLGPGVNRKPGEGGLRGHVKAGQDMPFAAKLTGNDAKADLFLSSLWALRTFGGLGARARRGFGTIEVTTPPDLPTASFDRAWLERNHATDLHAVLTCVSEALRSLNVVTALPDNDQPKYPSFRGGWYQLSDRQYATSAGDFANELSAVGDRLRKRRVDSDEPRASSVEYRDIVRPFMDNNQPSSTTPFSIGAFGLPVVFSRPKPPAQATVHAVHNGERIRRASPLWLRIYENRTTTQRPRWQCRSLAFDAEWLPQGAELSVENERGAKPVVIPNTEQLKSALNRWFT
jgi:CRISPR-associated protein Cmr1